MKIVLCNVLFYIVAMFVCFVFCIYLPLEQFRVSMSVCLSVCLSISLFLVILCFTLCNFVFVNFCVYLGDQLRFAFFLVARHECFILFYCFSIILYFAHLANKLTWLDYGNGTCI